MEETGNGRDINRHKYSLDEANLALEKPVVKALLDLCRFRNSHPAFQGEARTLLLTPKTYRKMYMFTPAVTPKARKHPPRPACHGLPEERWGAKSQNVEWPVESGSMYMCMGH